MYISPFFRHVVMLSVVVLATGSLATRTATAAGSNPSKHSTTSKTQALDYLEGLKGKTKNYLAPSQIDSRYNLALYVNAKGSGSNAQRMWVMQRDPSTGKFKLAMWDKSWWKSKRARKKYKVEEGEVPPFSWLVSTGRKWRGDKKSGPTSLGVFAMDERKGRTQKGWHSRGMIHAMYIDLHYRSGRRSGIAFHGTTRGQYRKLGRIASHGCIRMHQGNALGLLSRMKGWDGVLTEEQRWGDVPRFWKRAKGGRRYGYVRDGSLIHKQPAEQVKVAQASTVEVRATPIMSDIQKEPSVATKTGFRAISIIFKD